MIPLVWLLACTRTEPTPSRPVPPADAAVSVSADAAIVSSSRGCVVEPSAEQACVARGSGFAYGPTPFIYCSGIAANTTALAQQHAQGQVNAPCTCNDLSELQQRRQECSEVPSAPRR